VTIIDVVVLLIAQIQASEPQILLAIVAGNVVQIATAHTIHSMR
jgi:hypothetical protein